jgi:hypothetical protein
MFGISKDVPDSSGDPSYTRNSVRWDLNRSTFWRLELAYAEFVYIKCEIGRVWVTRSGDRKDYILREADEIWLQGPGTILAEGLGPAVLTSFTTGGSGGVIEHKANAASASSVG